MLIVIAAIEAVLELALRSDPLRAPKTPLWFAIPAIVLVVLPLLGRRRFPFAAPVLLWLAAALLSFIDGRLIVFASGVYVAGMLAAYLLGNLGDALQARIGLAVVLSGAAIVVYNDPNRTPGEFFFIPLLFAIAWLAGFALRERAVQAEAAEERAAHAERERESAARIAVAEERARIARELHDVVAHAVSVMVLQVGAVRHDLPQALERDSEALERVEQAGRTALAEMRRLLGALGRNGDGLKLAPQPGLEDLGPLLDDVGRAGLPVRLNVQGDPFALPRAIDLSAYRIVQEGLTNALKHARASRAEVTVRYQPDEVRIEVRDNGRGGSLGDGLGHGLVGLSERTKIFGGEMSAGRAPEGGFVLSARLPLGADER
ncbi:MAG TPA: sensor histidine kinase [Thermoleophilia bacterium]|nr:sensor histidine kinase [Thermoleophilia bacterium]